MIEDLELSERDLVTTHAPTLIELFVKHEGATKFGPAITAEIRQTADDPNTGGNQYINMMTHLAFMLRIECNNCALDEPLRSSAIMDLRREMQTIQFDFGNEYMEHLRNFKRMSARQRPRMGY